jgi:hypothetical protein
MSANPPTLEQITAMHAAVKAGDLTRRAQASSTLIQQIHTLPNAVSYIFARQTNRQT